ncbi:tetratricopeptide repeat protein [Sediminibacterium salmoneum]|uniref:tetratricopeptide repeat protein n=1 Tax=Sediminibacterium salmoneum TaxID=426421 RepID=UPI00047A2D3D|nr:tetratricopeptide repeat protein [Sediminibacterium salmoneum]
MKTKFLIWIGIFFCLTNLVIAQDISLLAKEAENFERQLKEPEALAKYKQILLQEPSGIKYLVKATELEIAMGSREKDANNKRLFFESALAYAERAIKADSNSADAHYAMASASGKMTDLDIDNKKIVAYVKSVKDHADKAVLLQPNHARANYTLGKWHYEMVTLSGFKKAAVKLFYGGLPNGDLDKAILYMEKCRTLEPYFVTNQLDLAKAYKENRQPAKAIEILERLVKMPNRSFNDMALKAEGAKLLASLQ